MPPPPVQSSSSAVPLDQGLILLKSFNSFLTVAIHNILFYRNIYPATTFLSAKAYNLPVHQNRHPKVCAWITDAVNAVGVQLASGQVSRIAVVIHSPLHRFYTFPQPQNPIPSASNEYDVNNTDSLFPNSSSLSNLSSSNASSSSAPHLQQPQAPPQPAPPQPSLSQSQSDDEPTKSIPPGSVLERWLFDVSKFPAWPGGPKPMRDFERVVLGKESRLEEARDRHLFDPKLPAGDQKNVSWPDVDEQFRGVLRRMAHAAEKMQPLPEGCTFTVAVELRDEGVAPIGYPQAWIPSEPNLQTASKGRDGVAGEDVGGVMTMPVRSAEAGPLYFECWVEEGKAKEILLAAVEKAKETEKGKQW
ncbi:DNA-binding protein [Apodospora peruviana]|uniref:DNA-binding protein n=1 Tax=Apodospora peruviana TaxID=516989 RepID=A0AAE0M4U8_9PEZI|nr:DNA-binding protein [Apodospora peruviana]